MDRRSITNAAVRRVIQLPPSPELPQGWNIDIPDRGTAFVCDVPGPTEDAPTLFLLHGMACTAYLNWFPSIEALRQKYRLVMMDMRGHGRGIPVGRYFRLSSCATDAIAVADVLGIEKFIPVGYSMGGPVAQLIWRQAPERVEGMVLCATARNFRGKPQERLFFMLLPALMMATAMRRKGRSRSSEGGRDAAETLARRLADIPDETRLSEVGVPSWAWGEFRRTSPWTMAQAVNAIGQFSSHRWISECDVPTAVVITARDRFIPPGRQLRLAQAIRGASVHSFAGNHAACVLEARKFVPTLVEACNSVAGRL
jgi:pimeloyl-ACP methyl ester carboxylesterase